MLICSLIEATKQTLFVVKRRIHRSNVTRMEDDHGRRNSDHASLNCKALVFFKVTNSKISQTALQKCPKSARVRYRTLLVYGYNSSTTFPFLLYQPKTKPREGLCPAKLRTFVTAFKSQNTNGDSEMSIFLFSSSRLLCCFNLEASIFLGKKKLFFS